MGAHAYVTANVLEGLAASAFTWAPASTTDRSFLNDGRMDRQMLVSASAASGLKLVIDLGSAQALVGFALLNHNAAAQKTDAAVRVRAADDAAITVNVVTAKAASTLYSAAEPRNKDHVLQFASVTKRYWELTFTWTGTVTNFSVGEVWAYSTVTQLTRRTIYGGSGEGRKMFTRVEEFDMGERRGLKLGGPQRMLDLTWSDLSPSQRDELNVMWAAVGADVSPFLWLNSYEATALAAATDEQNCLFGRFEQNELNFPEDDFQLYGSGGIRLRMRSAGREVGA